MKAKPIPYVSTQHMVVWKAPQYINTMDAKMVNIVYFEPKNLL